MWWILLLLALGILMYLSSLPVSYRVSRSIVIAKPVHIVFDYVRDVRHSLDWSPWSLHDPEAVMTFERPTEIGGGYDWSSSKIGQGELVHDAFTEHSLIEQTLTFISPFKSIAQIVWEFTPKGEGCEVRWTMDAKVPVFMAPIRPMMKRMIGFDFELGLARMRGQLDPSSEHPELGFDGKVILPAQTYVAERFSGTLTKMREVMQTAYPRLWQTISADTERWEHKPAIAAYHKVKPSQGTVVMDMGFAVKSIKAGERGLKLAAGQYFQMTMRGSYQFLPCAWNTIQGQVRMQKLKIDKSRPALEIYQTNPMEAQSSNDWVTLLCVPIK